MRESKQKRGRPAKFSQEWYDYVQRYNITNAKTRRGMQDAIWAYRYALPVIVHEEFDNKEFLYSDEKRYARISLLAEIGKLENRAYILGVAKLVCQRAALDKGYTVKKAIRFVKMIRFGGISEAASENDYIDIS